MIFNKVIFQFTTYTFELYNNFGDVKMYYISIKVDDTLFEKMAEYANDHGYGKGDKFNKAELCRNAIRHLVYDQEV